MLRRLCLAVSAALLLSVLMTVTPHSVATAAIPDVSIYADYPTITVQPGKQVKFPVRFTNNGNVDREIALTIDGPAEWKPQLKDRGFVIRRVYLAATKTVTVDFQADPPPSATAGDYQFTIQGVEVNGAGQTALNLVIGIDTQASAGIRLNTQYPVLRGGADKPFEFKVDLVNQSDEDRDFQLAARAPEGWEVVFQPAYEKRQISGLRVKAGETKGLDIQVTPTRNTRAGEYPVLIAVSSPPDQAQTELKVQVTGNYKANVTTPSGALNAQATAGEESRVTLLVQNTGSGDLTNVALSATKPDGWEVNFDPATIDRIPAGGSREVTMAVRPSGRAIPGDYMVRVTASNPQVSEQASVRVTVSSPTGWGIVGLGIIALSLGGLYGVFRRFSRR
ncbi:MAG TPA: NEW3 domain-containing protein [Chloroflexota bacterium]|nr:NEW3 domain-containing protein [Chloroflexota bacterium]